MGEKETWRKGKGTGYTHTLKKVHSETKLKSNKQTKSN